ncbi:MAG TPA: hypothetical protein VGD68_09200 [Streptosporangiaceae bacterium]
MDAAESIRLLRRYEPVLRFTRGELFLPMPVEAYLGKCGLWRSTGPGRKLGRRASEERLCSPGELTPARLATVSASRPGQDLSLRFVERPLARSEFRTWRRDAGRVRLAAGGSRFAAVGLLSRLIDAVMRLSLLLRGRVPGGTAAAAEQKYRADADLGSCPYYGRVTCDRGFVALQYWFFYAMNDWRSTFGGVNDHEADWEQVTIFLPDPPDVSARPAWVAFSSHDETGDDLRRRPDDPDLQWRDTHPVVFVGAGSHSGGYLPGDYLVTAEPAASQGLLAVLRRAGRLLLPWTRTHGHTAFGIPFIDYRRGDGPGVGPGEAITWHPVLVDDETPWLLNYRGLWGLDTGDPFGGERAPAGPRYEREGAVRLCWSDPVGWAGLDKEAPSQAVARQIAGDRIAELNAELAAATAEVDARGDELRRAHAGFQAVRSAGLHRNPGELVVLETAVHQARVRRRALAEERDILAGAIAQRLPRPEPHAHLRHRALPNVDPVRTRSRVLRVWSATSASLLLAGLAVVILGRFGALLPAFGGLAALMLCVEAFARGHLGQFVAGLLALVVAAAAAWLAATAAVGHWRWAVAAVLIVAALVLMGANVRDFFARR